MADSWNSLLKTNTYKTMKTVYIFLFIAIFTGACDNKSEDVNINNSPPTEALETETFTFLSNGTATKGKIYLPDSYDTNKNMPAIYLIDFREQHYEIVKDELEKVVAGVEKIEGFDALVVTLDEHLNIDAKPEGFQEYYEMFKNMTSYVDSNYTSNSSRTFIGRGSEAGIVMMTLFLEDSETSIFDNFIATDSPDDFNITIIDMIENDDFPQNKLNKKLHFSFSTSNDYDLCTTMINAISDADYPWLQFESIDYYDSNFNNTYPISFAAGIKFIFE